MTDFAALLSRSLPGIYRLKDDRPDGQSGDLARFLQIMASPLAETETSIAQLYDDLFGATARGELLPLVGALIGAEIDPTLPASLQRSALEDTLAFYRSKGLAEPLARTVEALTQWRTITVDYSQTVARSPHVDSLSPLQRQRRRPVGVGGGGNNRFHFDAAGRATRLFDDQRGRAIARTEIASLAADLIGTDRGFSIRESGVDLVGPRAPTARPVVAANLTDFAAPLTPAGAALSLTAGQIAVDPELGRMLFATPVPLAGNLAVDFHQLVPVATAQTFDLRDSARIAQLGRSDDPAPYSLDLRASDRPTDRIGRTHFDNHGFFLTVGRIFDNRRPNQLQIGPPAGFSFDDTLLTDGNTTGNVLQLLDGIDGSPITRTKLDGHAADFVDTPRGFTITARGTSLLDPSFGAGASVVAAKLNNLAQPKNLADAALTLATRMIAVDPQFGRFLLNVADFGITAGEIRVGYLMAPVAARTTGANAAPVGSPGSNTFAFASDGRMAPLRDGFDGTPLAVKLRLGSAISDYHGTARGYRIFVNGTDITSGLTPQLGAIEGPTAAATGKLLIDLDRGRFAAPSGTIAATAVVTVDFSMTDSAAEARVFDSLAQRLPRLVPAAVVPVVVDTREPTLDLSTFELTAGPRP